MAGQTKNDAMAEIPDIPQVVAQTLIYALHEGREEMLIRGQVVPFTTLVVHDDVFIEKHPGSTPAECYARARHTVEGALGATSYAFCYDGYVDTDEGRKDALIAEGGSPDFEQGWAVALLYEASKNADSKPEGDKEADAGTCQRQPQVSFKFSTEPQYIGGVSNFMKRLFDLKAAEEEALVEEADDHASCGFSNSADAAGADSREEAPA